MGRMVGGDLYTNQWLQEPLKVGFDIHNYPKVMTSSFAEWNQNQNRLLGIVKDRRNARLAPLFEGKQPPTACDGKSEPQISPSSIVAQLGPFPSEIFLKASPDFLAC